MDFFTVHFTLMQNEPKHQVDLRTLLRTSRVSCLILLPLLIIILQSLILIAKSTLPLVTSANHHSFPTWSEWQVGCGVATS